jgi:hypothetical protein
MAISRLDKTRFATVDLDIYSAADLRPLVDALGKRIIDLYVGRVKRTYEAHLELAWGRNQNPTSIILGFCRLIDPLPPAKRKLWDAAKTRSFDIGIASPVKRTHYWAAISPEAVKAAARIDAQIAITVYGPLKPAPSMKGKSSPS